MQIEINYEELAESDKVKLENELGQLQEIRVFWIFWK